MAPKIEDVSVEQFAKTIGVTSQRVYQLIQAGMPHRDRVRGKKTNTRVVPAEAIKWLRDRDRSEALAEKALNEAQERARKTRAEADMKELQLAQLRRELVPASEASTFCEAFAGGFDSVAKGQLGRFEREMVKVTTAAEARVLKNKIVAALMKGAQRYAASLEAEAEKLDANDASPESPSPDADTP